MSLQSPRPLALLCMLFVLPAASLTADDGASQPQPKWRAGVATTDITPDEPIWMSGYAARDSPAKEALHPLRCKAIALEDPDGQRAVLVTLDVLGLDRATTQKVCDTLRDKHDLDRSQIALATSHTHSGPVVGRNLAVAYFLSDEQWQKIQAYTAELREMIVATVDRAMQDLGPAHLTWGVGKATFAVNRRQNKPYSKVPEWRKAGELKGPVVHDVPTLLVRDGRAGELRAMVFGYACHSTTLSWNKWSGDYPGFAQLELEKRHPEAVALFWAGAGGDQNPLPRREVALAEQYGDRLADAVDSVIRGMPQKIEGGLTTRYTTVDLPYESVPSRADLQATIEDDDANRYHRRRARLLLHRIANNGPLKSSYPYPVQVWQLGETVDWAILGGEVTIGYTRRLKREMNGKNTWVTAYANDVMSYIPTEKVLEEGGYEGRSATVYYGLPSPWAPGLENTIVNKVHELAGE